MFNYYTIGINRLVLTHEMKEKIFEKNEFPTMNEHFFYGELSHMLIFKVTNRLSCIYRSIVAELTDLFFKFYVPTIIEKKNNKKREP